MLVYSKTELQAAIKDLGYGIASARKLALTETNAETRARFEQKAVELAVRLIEVTRMLEVAS